MRPSSIIPPSCGKRACPCLAGWRAELANPPPEIGDATKLAHTGRPSADGPVNPPVERASTFVYAESGRLYGRGRRYGRMGVSVHDALAEALTALQGATRTLITSSGLSACTAPFRAFAVP